MRINFAFTQSQPPAPVVPQDSPRPGRAPAYLPNPCPARPEGSSFATTAQVTAQVCSGLPSPSCPRKVPASVRITRPWKVNVLPSPSSFVADEDHLCAGSPISRFPQSQLPAPVLPQDSPRPCLAPAYRPNPCPARLEGSSFATTAQRQLRSVAFFPSPSYPRKVPASVRITRSWKVNVLPSPSSFVADEDQLCAGSPISRFPSPSSQPRFYPRIRPDHVLPQLTGLTPVQPD